MINTHNKIFIFTLPLYIMVHLLTKIYFLHNYVDIEVLNTKDNTEKLTIALKKAIQNKDIKTADKIIQVFKEGLYHINDLNDINNALILKANKDAERKYIYNFIYLFILLFYIFIVFQILAKDKVYTE
ncbi:hypothetical protein [uncultured Gammaproteobacteria bacterium]|nr:hypothetical protein [uncultured Gammaproteobacteria bacterium]